MLACALAFVVAAQDPVIPLADGATWTYSLKKKADVGGLKVTKEGTATLTCKPKEEFLGVEYWVLHWEETTSKETLRSVIFLREDGGRIVIGKLDNDHAPLVPVDLKAKESKVKILTGRNEVEVESVVGDEEEIEVPAGKFKAPKVTATASVGGSVKVTRTVWYVKGTGPVKVVRTGEVGGGVTVEKEYVLTKFEKK